MPTNYYPWKMKVLAEWLMLEMSTGKSPQDLAETLHSSQHLIHQWLMLPAAPIGLEHIRAIAHYRGWSFDKTVRWLGIGLAHLEELRARSGNQSSTSKEMHEPTSKAEAFDGRLWIKGCQWGKAFKSDLLTNTAQCLQLDENCQLTDEALELRSISYRLLPRAYTLTPIKTGLIKRAIRNLLKFLKPLRSLLQAMRSSSANSTATDRAQMPPRLSSTWRVSQDQLCRNRLPLSSPVNGSGAQDKPLPPKLSSNL